jgi:hypothetical protein
MFRTITLALTAVLAGLLLAGTALADVANYYHQPPATYVRVSGKVVGEMKRVEYSWYYSSEDGGYAHIADRFPGEPRPPYVFPKAQRVEAGRVNFINYSPDKPEKFVIRRKDGKLVPSHLYPILWSNGKLRGWGAYFEHKGDHRYILRAKWEKIPGKDGSFGTATYLVRLKTH